MSLQRAWILSGHYTEMYNELHCGTHIEIIHTTKEGSDLLQWYIHKCRFKSSGPHCLIKHLTNTWLALMWHHYWFDLSFCHVINCMVGFIAFKMKFRDISRGGPMCWASPAATWSGFGKGPWGLCAMAHVLYSKSITPPISCVFEILINLSHAVSFFLSDSGRFLATP